MNIVTAILRYLIYLPLHITLTALSYILVPFLVLFQKDGWLPKWCWYFQTWDNSLDGDTGWQIEHRPFLSEPYETLSGFKKYICRVLWLYRNPVYGFEKTILAASEGDITQYGVYPNVLYVSSKGYFFYNGEVNINTSTKFNWLIGWKLVFPSRPISICTTLRFQSRA